jgi:hypothetical protein
MRALADLAASAYGLLFVAAAAGKLDSWGAWSELARKIPGPPTIRPVVQVIVPVGEGVVAVLCFAAPIAGLAAAAVLLAGFAIAVGLMQPRLGGQECNCFGAIAPALINTGLVVRNAILAALAAAVFYAAWRLDLRPLSPLQALAAALFGAIALMLFEFRRLRDAARTARAS